MWVLWDRGPISLFCNVFLHFSQHHYLKRLSFHHLIFLSPMLNTGWGFNFWHFFVPLANVSIFGTTTVLFLLLWLCSLIWNLEMWDLWLFFFLRNALAIWDLLWFHIILGLFFYFRERPLVFCWRLQWICRWLWVLWPF